MTAYTDLTAALLKDVRPEIEKAIYDPGTTEGYKGDRTLTAWQTDAVMRAVLAALTAALDPALSERAGEVTKRLDAVSLDVGYSSTTTLDSGVVRQAADLITALLAQNAALRAERDGLQQWAENWRQSAKKCLAHAEKQEARAEAAEAVAEKLRGAADWQEKQRRDAFARRHINAPEDPHVAALCERYGYGAVMDAASRLWARKDSVGAFYIGGCIGIKPDAALTTEADNEQA